MGGREQWGGAEQASPLLPKERMTTPDAEDRKKEIAFLEQALVKLTGEPEVLIVEDDATDEFLLLRGLNQFFCRVTTCRSGEEAIQLIKNKRFDFIFLDMKLPDVDGFQILKSTEANRRGTAVVMLSFSKPISDDALGRMFVRR